EQRSRMEVRFEIGMGREVGDRALRGRTGSDSEIVLLLQWERSIAAASLGERQETRGCDRQDHVQRCNRIRSAAENRAPWSHLILLLRPKSKSVEEGGFVRRLGTIMTCLGAVDI